MYTCLSMTFLITYIIISLFLIDIWSLGVILYMLVCGAAPFQEANDSETLTMIMDCNYIVPSHISQQCQDLISSMLCRDPAKRATLEQVTAFNPTYMKILLLISEQPQKQTYSIAFYELKNK